MKIKEIVSVLILATIAIPALAGNTALDVRFGNNTESNNKDSRIKFMHSFDGGLYFSAEGAQSHGDENFFDENDSNEPIDPGFRGSSQEYELAYKFPINGKWFLAPGLIWVNTNSASDYRPYFKAGTTFDNGVSITGRYRYNWSNDANGKAKLNGSGTTRGASHQYDIWLARKYGKLGLLWNPRYRFQHGVDQGTGDDDYWEHTIEISYQYDDKWKPYMELVSLDETYVDKDGNHKNDYAVRLGFVLKL